MKETEFPLLDGILAAELENGAYISKQDGCWWLFAKTGDGIAHGETISKMLVNLILVKG